MSAYRGKSVRAPTLFFSRGKSKTEHSGSFLIIKDMVGVTRLELATSRPPAVRATNCATPRLLKIILLTAQSDTILI
jgi:hypothetical protein